MLFLYLLQLNKEITINKTNQPTKTLFFFWLLLFCFFLSRQIHIHHIGIFLCLGNPELVNKITKSYFH